jgi:hypothetical protein
MITTIGNKATPKTLKPGMLVMVEDEAIDEEGSDIFIIVRGEQLSKPRKGYLRVASLTDGEIYTVNPNCVEALPDVYIIHLSNAEQIDLPEDMR